MTARSSPSYYTSFIAYLFGQATVTLWPIPMLTLQFLRQPNDCSNTFCQCWHSVAGMARHGQMGMTTSLIPIRRNRRDHLFQSIPFPVPMSLSVYPKKLLQVFQQPHLLLAKPEAAIVVLRFGE